MATFNQTFDLLVVPPPSSMSDRKIIPHFSCANCTTNSNAPVWPFAAAIIMAQDITYGLQELSKSIFCITLRSEE